MNSATKGCFAMWDIRCSLSSRTRNSSKRSSFAGPSMVPHLLRNEQLRQPALLYHPCCLGLDQPRLPHGSLSHVRFPDAGLLDLAGGVETRRNGSRVETRQSRPISGFCRPLASRRHCRRPWFSSVQAPHPDCMAQLSRPACPLQPARIPESRCRLATRDGEKSIHVARTRAKVSGVMLCVPADLMERDDGWTGQMVERCSC